jgi:hypothetical protein
MVDEMKTNQNSYLIKKKFDEVNQRDIDLKQIRGKKESFAIK